MIGKQLAAIRKNKSMGPNGVPGEILKLGMEAMIPYHTRLLGITISNATIPSDWKRAMVVPIYKGGNRSVVTNYRPVSLTLLVCTQTEYVIAGYPRQVWDTSKWLYERQHELKWDNRAKAKQSQLARTQLIPWMRESE
jgi:hypothetical protein